MTDEALPSLSVVLCSRNGERFLPVQLAAIREQQYPAAWEVVLIDDGSTDGTSELLRAAADRSVGEPRHRMVRTAGLGMAAARNVGSEAAAMRCLLFVDHDDEMAPGYLLAMGRALARHELVAARIDGDALNPGWIGRYRPHQQRAGLSRDFLPFANAGTLGVRASTFLALGGFDGTESMPDDRDLCFRAALLGIELVFVPDAVLRYRHRRELRAILHQARRGGRGTVALYRRFRVDGMAPRLLKAEIMRWLDVVGRLVVARSTEERARQIHALGLLIGHLEGCVRYRVWWFCWNPTAPR